MHPEVQQNTPGKCPKCGMALVQNSKFKVQNDTKNSYTPLLVVIGLICLITAALGLRDYQLGLFGIKSTITYFMIGFFLTFAGFKLMDLKGFAEGYATYDILTKKVYAYGYMYPFIELLFGIFMIMLPQSFWLYVFEFLIMTFSGIGILIKLAKHEKFQCACLGTFLKVPLTKVTLVEDFGMAILALLMLLLR